MFATRSHDILAFPVFVDESLHILRAQVVYDFSDPVASFLPGKVLTYYYLGLFQPQNHNGLWLSRMAIAGLAPLALAFSIAILKALHFKRSGVIFAAFFVTIDILFLFFGKMALADPFALVFCFGVIWSSLMWIKAFSPRWGILTGCLLGLALLAKLTALPFIAVPVLAIVFFRRGAMNYPPTYSKLGMIYVVAGLYLALPLAYVVYQEAAQVENKQEVVTTTLFIPQERTRVEQIEYNLSVQSQTFIAGGLLFNIFIFVIALPSLRNKETRPKLLFMLSILGLSSGFILITSAFPSTRYLMISYPLIPMLGVFFPFWFQDNCHLCDDLPRLVFPIGIASFIYLLYFGNIATNLTRLDEWEYYSHTSSGYGLREAAHDILTLESEAIPLLSTVGSCHSIRFYFPEHHPVKLHCPYFGFYGNPILLTREEWRPYAEELGNVYVLTENKPAIDVAEVEIEWIWEYPRPLEGKSVYLFKTPFREDLAELFPPLDTRNNSLPQ